jgi:hypothetical protein
LNRRVRYLFKENEDQKEGYGGDDPNHKTREEVGILFPEVALEEGGKMVVRIGKTSTNQRTEMCDNLRAAG